MLDARLPSIPDDWTVWAFSDIHGVTSGFVTALQAAGILDEALQWMAPPRTALVGCGDYIDRGGDIRGLVELLQRLQADATSHGGAVILARGNHEVMPLIIRDGGQAWLATWLEYGGDATLGAFACDDALPSPDGPLASLEHCAPDLFPWLRSLPHAVRWRDVVFVHGGLPPGGGLADLGTRTDAHLWIRAEFFDTPWADPGFDAYRTAGVERVVFGHTPQPSGLTLFQGGHALDIDTNAVGDPRMPDGAVQAVTLLGLVGDASFEEARLVSVDTTTSPERMRR
jgi:hypothetical protein